MLKYIWLKNRICIQKERIFNVFTWKFYCEFINYHIFSTTSQRIPNMILIPWRKQQSDKARIHRNKSNGVRTIDAFSRVLVLLYRTFICSFVLLLLKSSSDSYTFLFQTLIYRNFGQKRRFWSISTRLWRTDGPTDRRTDHQTDRRTDGRTHPLIESWLTTINLPFSFCFFLRLDSSRKRPTNKAILNPGSSWR